MSEQDNLKIAKETLAAVNARDLWSTDNFVSTGSRSSLPPEQVGLDACLERLWLE